MPYTKPVPKTKCMRWLPDKYGMASQINWSANCSATGDAKVKVRVFSDKYVLAAAAATDAATAIRRAMMIVEVHGSSPPPGRHSLSFLRSSQKRPAWTGRGWRCSTSTNTWGFPRRIRQVSGNICSTGSSIKWEFLAITCWMGKEIQASYCRGDYRDSESANRRGICRDR